jgi:uncharacterized MAPEG superfamily protein
MNAATRLDKHRPGEGSLRLGYDRFTDDDEKSASRARPDELNRDVPTIYLLSHVLFGKPVFTFPGHAPGEENHMSTELKYLAFTALLTASLWIPYVVAQVMTNGFLIPENYVDPKQRPLPLWGQRADRAHLNAVETFAPFAALVLLIQATGKADAMTAFWAVSYFWLRVAHAIVYLAAWPYIRTLIFVLGWVCVVGVFVELVK